MASTAGDAHDQRAFRGRLLVILLTRTGLNTAYRMVYPFLPSIARGLGISLQAASGLVTLRMVAGLGAPILGLAGDRYGRRRTMEVGLLLLALASVLLVGLGTVAAAAIAFFLYGLAKVLYDPAVQAYIGDTVPYQERGRAMGIVELSWSAAWLVGVPVAGFLIERFGWKAPWAVLVVWGLMGAWLTHTRLPSSSPSATPSHDPKTDQGQSAPSAVTGAQAIIAIWRSLLRRRPVLALLSVSLLLAVASEVSFIVYGAWLETAFGLTLSVLGFASIVVGLAEAAAELGSAALTDRLGKRRSVLIGSLGLAGSLVLLPWLSQHGLAAALAGVALMLLTFEFGIVSLLPIATEIAPDARASLLSLNITAMSLGRILGAIVGAWLWQWQNIALPAAVGASCAVLAAVFMALGIKEITDHTVTARPHPPPGGEGTA